jgi:hypothetical protein
LDLPTDSEIKQYAEDMGISSEGPASRSFIIEQLQSEKEFKKQFQLEKDARQLPLAEPERKNQEQLSSTTKAFTQQLSRLEADATTQKKIPAEPETPPGAPLTTQKDAYGTPSIEELAKSSPPLIKKMAHELLEPPPGKRPNPPSQPLPEKKRPKT